MNWRKEKNKRVWIGRGQHTTTIVALQSSGNYSAFTSATEITFNTLTTDTLPESIRWAEAAEQSQANEITNPTAATQPPEQPSDHT